MNTKFTDPNARFEFIAESRAFFVRICHKDYTAIAVTLRIHADAIYDAFAVIDSLEAELRTKNDELHTLRFIGQQPETLTGKPPGTLDIVPGPPTLKQRIKAAIAAFKRN